MGSFFICGNFPSITRHRRGRDHMVVGFIATYAISAYYY
jgi:hypothetical protein